MLQQVKADLNSEYGPGLRLKKLAALFLNPSMRACFLIRVATGRSRVGYWVGRNLLITFHSIDVGRGVKIGAPLRLPHPLGIVFGKGVVLAEGVTIYQGVTLGTKNDGYPSIAKEATIYPNAVIVGGVSIGDGATVGAGRFVDTDVPAMSIFR